MFDLRLLRGRGTGPFNIHTGTTGLVAPRTRGSVSRKEQGKGKIPGYLEIKKKMRHSLAIPTNLGTKKRGRQDVVLGGEQSRKWSLSRQRAKKFYYDRGGLLLKVTKGGPFPRRPPKNEEYTHARSS